MLLILFLACKMLYVNICFYVGIHAIFTSIKLFLIFVDLFFFLFVSLLFVVFWSEGEHSAFVLLFFALFHVTVNFFV